MEATKVISFRVPMQDYIKLLTQATSLKMSISDYVLMKVYGPDGEIKDLESSQARPEPTKTPAPGVNKPENKPIKPRSVKTAPKAGDKPTGAKKEAQKPSEKPKKAKPKSTPTVKRKKPAIASNKPEMQAKEDEQKQLAGLEQEALEVERAIRMDAARKRAEEAKKKLEEWKENNP